MLSAILICISMTVAALRPVSWSDPMDLAELHSFRLVYFKHKEIFLVVCIVSDGSAVLPMPVYRFSLIWSPATRLVNRDRSDKGGPCRLHRAFSYTNILVRAQNQATLSHQIFSNFTFVSFLCTLPLLAAGVRLVAIP